VLTAAAAALVLAFLGYLIALSTYDDKQRKFDEVYTGEFVDDAGRGRAYRSAHADLLEKVPTLNLKEKDLSQLSAGLVRDSETLGRSYGQILDCILDNTCTPGWKKFWFCRTASQDWWVIQEIRRKAKDSGVTVVTDTPAPANALPVPTPANLGYLLAKVCNQNS